MKLKSLKTLFIVLVIILSSLSGNAPVFAGIREEPDRIVRVGYVEIDNMMEGMSDDSLKSGFGYDYLQKVSYYTNWKYEYVYGDWDEILAMLSRGEVDVMADVSKTEQRKETMLFPDYPMGVESYYIYVREEEAHKYCGSDGLKGKTVSVNKDSIMEQMLREWDRNGNYQIKIKTYPGTEARYKGVEKGESGATVDADNAMNNDRHMVPLAKIGSSDYFLAVSNKRPDLLNELNDTLRRITATDPDFTRKLSDKYFSKTTGSTILQEDELKWIQNNPEIRFGYLRDYLPFSEENARGQAIGIITDITREIFDKLNLQEQVHITYVPYDSVTDMIRALQKEQIDVAFPVEDDVAKAEKEKIYLTTSLINTTMNIVYKGTYRNGSKLKRLGVQRGDLVQEEYIKRHFPDTGIVRYKSFEAELEAVRNGDVDAIVISDFRKEMYLIHARYKGMNTEKLPEQSRRCIALNAGKTELLSILNRGITNLSDSFAQTNTYKYTAKLENYGIEDYMLGHSVYVIFAGTLAVAVITAIIVCIGGLIGKRRMLDEMAHNDSMTGLLNRRAYDERADHYGEKPVHENLMILEMDLNGLKRVNDTLGHEAGDELIIGAATCMKTVLGKYGDIYRVGGDEFIAIVFRDKISDGSLLQELKREFSNWKGRKCGALYVAVGYCYSDEKAAMTIREMVSIADQRLYEEKKHFYEINGRDRRQHYDDEKVMK
jgi:diguanylate cyclase (GGDEF)-like protein